MTKVTEQGGVNHQVALLEKYGLVSPDAVVPLPSKGIIYKLYDDGSALSELQIRAMTVKEMDILANRMYIEDLTFIRRVLSSCIIPPDKGWPPKQSTADIIRELVNGDLETLLLALRTVTYGTTYTFEQPCEAPRCDNSLVGEIDLSQFETKELQESPLELGTNQFVVQDNKIFNNAEVIISLATVRISEELHAEQQQREARRFDQKGRIHARLEKAVVRIGEEKSRGDITFLLSKLGADGVERLQELLEEKLDFGPVLESSGHKCSKCSRVQDIHVPLAQAVFFR